MSRDFLLPENGGAGVFPLVRIGVVVVGVVVITHHYSGAHTIDSSLALVYRQQYCRVVVLGIWW